MRSAVACTTWLLLAAAAGAQPSPTPEVPEPPLLRDILVEADYLLLAPRRAWQTYAIVGLNPFWGPIGVVKSLDGNYDSGFRVGAGFRFADDWEALLRYTYFHSAAEDAVSRPPQGSV